jgi:hypothetical protein
MTVRQCKERPTTSAGVLEDTVPLSHEIYIMLQKFANQYHMTLREALEHLLSKPWCYP